MNQMKAKNIIFVSLRVLLVVALIGAIIYYFFLQKPEINVPFTTVKTRVAAAIQSKGMSESTSRFFKKYYNQNAEEYDGVLLYAPNSNMDADEVLLVKARTSDQAENLIEIIKTRQQTKANSFEGYAPEQYALCQNYILNQQGNYILFAVSANADKIDAAFKSAIAGK